MEHRPTIVLRIGISFTTQNEQDEQNEQNEQNDNAHHFLKLMCLRLFYLPPEHFFKCQVQGALWASRDTRKCLNLV